MIKAAHAVVFLIPGLILGAAFKGLAYLFSEVRGKHSLAKEHFTPVNREIGSVSSPITTREELLNALEEEHQSNPKNRPTTALIIHGNGNLTINEDPGILRFNPMKLVLEGARIVNEPFVEGLNDVMYRTCKWEVSMIRVEIASNPGNSGANSQSVNSVDDALRVTAPRRSWTSCKRYHMIFNLTRPQVV